MVQSLAWNDENNMLAALTDGKLIVFYYPNVIYVDRYLLPRTVYERDIATYEILSFTSCRKCLSSPVTRLSSVQCEIHVTQYTI